MNSGLSYPIQQTFTIIGSKDASDTRTGIELESTYSTTEDTEPTKSFRTGGMSKLSLDILYTMGASETSNSIEMKVEGSPDGTNWYRLATDTTSGGTSTIAAREWTFVGTNGTTATINVLLDIAYENVRVSLKETGVAANKGNVYVEATLSGK